MADATLKNKCQTLMIIIIIIMHICSILTEHNAPLRNLRLVNHAVGTQFIQ